MKTITITCNRCAATITEAGSIITIEAGNLRGRLHNPVDLCESCAGKLLEWLMTVPSPDQESGKPTCLFTS